MTLENFEEIFQLIKDDTGKKKHYSEITIPPRIKLAATFRFLSTVELYSTLSLFVPEVCQAIFNRLKEKYMKVTVQLCFGVLKTR